MTEKKKDGNGEETKAAATREEAADATKKLGAAEKRLADIRCARREEKLAADQWENDRIRAQKSKKEWEKKVNAMCQVIDNDQLDLFGRPLSNAQSQQVIGRAVAEHVKGARKSPVADAGAKEGKEPKPDDLIKLGLKLDEKGSAPVPGKKKPRARQKLLTHHTGKSGPAQTTA